VAIALHMHLHGFREIGAVTSSGTESALVRSVWSLFLPSEEYSRQSALGGFALLHPRTYCITNSAEMQGSESCHNRLSVVVGNAYRS